MGEIRKILIADDHSIVSRGLYYLLTLHFSDVSISEAHSLDALMKALSTDCYSHLILDINLDTENSIEVLPQIIENYPDMKILIYSMISEEVYGRKLMQYKINGFLSKKTEEREILDALRIFLDGGIYMSRKLRNETLESDNVFHTLSNTEMKVLRDILRGNRTKEIANSMGVTQQTIATYKARIFKKLGTENIFEIQKMAELFNITTF